MNTPGWRCGTSPGTTRHSRNASRRKREYALWQRWRGSAENLYRKAAKRQNDRSDPALRPHRAGEDPLRTGMVARAQGAGPAAVGLEHLPAEVQTGQGFGDAGWLCGSKRGGDWRAAFVGVDAARQAGLWRGFPSGQGAGIRSHGTTSRNSIWWFARRRPTSWRSP